MYNLFYLYIWCKLWAGGFVCLCVVVDRHQASLTSMSRLKEPFCLNFILRFTSLTVARLYCSCHMSLDDI